MNKDSQNNKTQNSKQIILGMDFGTSNSCLVKKGYDGKPEVIINEEGKRTTPTAIYIGEDNKYKTGSPALNNLAVSKELVITGVKRLIGRKMEEISNIKSYLQYEVAAGKNDAVEVVINGKRYSPVELSAIFIKDMITKAIKKDNPKSEIIDVKLTITCPAYFASLQRSKLMLAAVTAGIKEENIKIINEPTSAALAYGEKLKTGSGTDKILVFDWVVVHLMLVF